MNTRATPSRFRSGFSLMEIMVAVALLAIALVGLTRGLTTALISSRDSAAYSQAVWVAASRIESLRSDYLPSEGETEGETGGFSWRQTIARTPTDGLFEIRVAVSRKDETGTIYTLETMIFDPPLPSEVREKDKGNRRDRRRREGAR